MKARILILLCFLLCGARAVAGGGTELGGIVSLEFNKSLPRHFNISLEEELRFDHDHPNFDRWLNSLGVDYDFYRGRMSVGLRGDYIRRYNNDGFFENRVRTALVFSYCWCKFFMVIYKNISTRYPLPVKFAPYSFSPASI